MNNSQSVDATMTEQIFVEDQQWGLYLTWIPVLVQGFGYSFISENTADNGAACSMKKKKAH